MLYAARGGPYIVDNTKCTISAGSEGDFLVQGYENEVLMNDELVVISYSKLRNYKCDQ